MEFSTAVAVQVAATYPEAAKQLQDLIETVFAQPFCQQEKAEGRYGPLLRPLPIEVRTEEDVQSVNVDCKKQILLRLPRPQVGFAKIINKIRESTSGKNLRNAMNNLGVEPDFASATNAWQAVAHDLARLVSSTDMKEIKLSTHLVTFGRTMFVGAFADFAIHPPHSVADFRDRLSAPALGACMEVAGHLTRLIPAERKRQRIPEQLEKAVDFSCVKHPTIKPL